MPISISNDDQTPVTTGSDSDVVSTDRVRTLSYDRTYKCYECKCKFVVNVPDCYPVLIGECKCDCGHPYHRHSMSMKPAGPQWCRPFMFRPNPITPNHEILRRRRYDPNTRRDPNKRKHPPSPLPPTDDVVESPTAPHLKSSQLTIQDYMNYQALKAQLDSIDAKNNKKKRKVKP